MRRRAVGVGAVRGKEKERNAYGSVGQAAYAENMAHVQALLDTFKDQLEVFANKHRKDINRDPAFRQQFQTMCSSIGVDPLASNKGFWGKILGVGDFYYELAVQVIEVCIAARETTGGILELDHLLERLRKKRSAKSPAISADDIKRAVGKLKVLGAGFTLVEKGRTTMILSVPKELSGDAAAVLQVASRTGTSAVTCVASELGWNEERAKDALFDLVKDGMAWVDEQAGAETVFFFPSFWNGCSLLDERS